MATKSTSRTAGRKPSAGASQKVRGNITPAEIKPLILEAKAAFAMQIELANIEPTTDFDAWRAEQVMACVELPGLSCLDHDHFRPVLAHFAELAGKDEKALDLLLGTGRVKDHGPEEDTHDKRRQLACLICDNLTAHIRLAESSAIDLATGTEETDEYRLLAAARTAIKAHKQGPIREGYLVWLARQKFRRPDLTFGRDLQAGLADRLSVRELTQLLSTLRNRISTREGRAVEKKRAPGKFRRKMTKKLKAAALDTPAGTAHRPIAKSSPDDPF